MKRSKRRHLKAIRQRMVDHNCKGPEFVDDRIETMRCRNEFVSGCAVWMRKSGVWTCESADKGLEFLRKLDPAGAKFELARRGYEWCWIGFPKVPATGKPITPEELAQKLE